MLNDENPNTVNFLSRDCKDSKHESCINKGIGLGFNFNCNCNCHKLNIIKSRDTDLNPRIHEYILSSNVQRRNYDNIIERNVSRYDNVKNLKENYSKNCNDEKGSSKLSFSPIFPIIWQYIIESGDPT